jgi:hypothetical protein
VAVSEAPIWQWIAIWRAAGWSLLLAFLVYAPVRAFSLDKRVDPGRRIFALVFSAQVWFVILLASYRSGGDQWDNPRYRAAFAALQIALAAWAWVDQRSVVQPLQRPDPWLRRLLWLVGSLLLWFIPWYLNRYVGFPWLARDLFKTLGLGLATAILLGLVDWVRQANSDR